LGIGQAANRFDSDSMCGCMTRMNSGGSKASKIIPEYPVGN
jgi:hypothetical protein